MCTQTERESETPSSGKKEGKAKEEGKEGREGKRGSGWLGGILTRLSLRAPNQMILPDDKNPTVSAARPRPRIDVPTLL